VPPNDENIQRSTKLDTSLTEARRQLGYHQLQSKRH